MYSFEANPPNVCSSPNTSPELMRKFSDNNTPLIPWETFTKQPANHKVNVSYCCDEPTLCSWSVGKAMQHKPHGFVMEMAGYKYRALTLTQSQTSLCSPETETSMAPHSVIISTFDHQRFTDKDKFKLRKPMIEKMRRDRINNCIDQLKKLLEKELCSQDPNSKLEKADILEMTVSFLKQQQRLPGALAQRDYNQGYSQCWRESLHFLNVHSNRGQSTMEVQQIQQRSSTEHSHNLSAHISKDSHATQQHPYRPVWRPW